MCRALLLDLKVLVWLSCNITSVLLRLWTKSFSVCGPPNQDNSLESRPQTRTRWSPGLCVCVCVCVHMIKSCLIALITSLFLCSRMHRLKEEMEILVRELQCNNGIIERSVEQPPSVESNTPMIQ